MITYRYLIRRAGRGLTVAHLVTTQGEAVCGLRLGDAWELVKATRRRVCARCRKAHHFRPATLAAARGAL